MKSPAKIRRQFRQKYISTPNPPEHLLDRHEVCAIAHASYPAVWEWMRAGTFPRARTVVGRSMWLASEIKAWLDALPVSRLKGDEEEAEKLRSDARNAERKIPVRAGEAAA